MVTKKEISIVSGLKEGCSILRLKSESRVLIPAMKGMKLTNRTLLLLMLLLSTCGLKVSVLLIEVVSANE
jgi:hypothetical protein